MFEKVRNAICEHNLLSPGDRVVVGVSGGPDSVAMLHILLRLRENDRLYLHVAHLNHQFRGKDADADADFVAALAQKWEVDWMSRTVDVPALSRERGLSPEEAGRQARYSLFEEVASQNDCNKIAVAHHSDDQAETVLLNLIRGAGTEGLAGMKPMRDDKIVRPLLFVSRSEIEQYCLANNLETRLDESNLQADYRRNKIRLELIPRIEEEYNPKFRSALVRTARILGDENDLLQKMAQEVVSKHAVFDHGAHMLPLWAVEREHVALQRRIIRKMIACQKQSETGIAFDHVEQVLALVDTAKTGKRVSLAENLEAFIEYGRLGIAALQQSHPQISIKKKLNIPGLTAIPDLGYRFHAEYVTQTQKRIDENEDVVFVDTEHTTLPLYVRLRKDGDRIELPGGIGTSKIKKIMIDKKVSQRKRGNIPLVVDADDRIIWLVGFKTSIHCLQDFGRTGSIRIEVERYNQGG